VCVRVGDGEGVIVGEVQCLFTFPSTVDSAGNSEDSPLRSRERGGKKLQVKR
jgi:hypothetical protein